MASTQHSSLPTSHFNIVEHTNNHHKQQKSKHGEQEEEQQEVLEYTHHEDEPPQTSCGSSRTSVSSSPSHEFSFTVCSLYTSPSTTADNDVFKESLNNFSTSSAAATAIDLSPADEIFSHGHLLPLHLSSGGRLSISPRSSTNSLDSFTLPITSFSNPSSSIASSSMDDQDAQDRAIDNTMEKIKSRSFSLFRNKTTTSKSRNQTQNQETAESSRSKPHQEDDNHKNLNKVKFDLSSAIKQYAKLVRPLLSFKQANSISNNSRRQKAIQMRGQTFSYSGNLSRPRSDKQGTNEVLKGRYSAPASMRNSPTNSAMFLESSKSNNSSSGSNSTMEELQAAIQAAIAHCKNSSIAAEAVVQDKI